jgi:GTP cyclohydrolase I
VDLYRKGGLISAQDSPKEHPRPRRISMYALSPEREKAAIGRRLEDVAREQRPLIEGHLDRVGMTEIEMPIRMRGPDGAPLSVAAQVDAFVSLDDPAAKGIHMSRIFLLLQETLEKELLELPVLETLLRGFVESHRPISRSAFVELRFGYMLRRPALRSGHSGWRSYPVRISCGLDKGEFDAELQVRVAYSSTCPCSAALARQHIQDRFLEEFGAGGSIPSRDVANWLGRADRVSATPHSQRSYADVRVRIAPEGGPDLSALIDRVESALQTPVQAAVKRVDEQEFARRNGENLMFCEDAARRVQNVLLEDPGIRTYAVRVEHQESLHPHNAVASVAGEISIASRPKGPLHPPAVVPGDQAIRLDPDRHLQIGPRDEPPRQRCAVGPQIPSDELTQNLIAPLRYEPRVREAPNASVRGSVRRKLETTARVLAEEPREAGLSLSRTPKSSLLVKKPEGGHEREAAGVLAGDPKRKSSTAQVAPNLLGRPGSAQRRIQLSSLPAFCSTNFPPVE